MERTGVFKVSAPVAGLRYETKTHRGKTGEMGEFSYLEGEDITFSLGRMVLGSGLAKARMTPADLSCVVAGNPTRLNEDKVTNITRLLMSIDPAHSVEDAIVVSEAVGSFCQAPMSLLPRMDEAHFQGNEAIVALMGILGTELCSPERARNYLRRTMAGIKKLTDVKVPTRDGEYVLADVYMPDEPGQYPAIISFGGYGKAFWTGQDFTEESARRAEIWEDRYFTGIREGLCAYGENAYIFAQVDDPQDFGKDGGAANAEQFAFLEDPALAAVMEPGALFNYPLTHTSEFFERANTRDWVPRGYVCIFVDSRGLGKVPGFSTPFGRPEADDFYDAIEWAGVQPWCTGKVGIYGASFYAMNAFNVASLQPPHLSAMLAFCGDGDWYRDNDHFGGLSCLFSASTRRSFQEPWQGIEIAEFRDKTPFFDPEVHNDHCQYPIVIDRSKINVPFYTTMPADIMNFIHTRGTSETFIDCSTPAEQKHMDIISDVGIHFWMYDPRYLEKHFRFFDY